MCVHGETAIWQKFHNNEYISNFKILQFWIHEKCFLSERRVFYTASLSFSPLLTKQLTKHPSKVYVFTLFLSISIVIQTLSISALTVWSPFSACSALWGFKWRYTDAKSAYNWIQTILTRNWSRIQQISGLKLTDKIRIVLPI